jgi:YesN/AraC family two-component response regulator
MKKVILVVDDEVVIRKVLGEMISTSHPEAIIIHAEHGAHAWELINAGQSFDLMITDVVMPVMNGVMLVEKVRRDFPFMRTILMSGTPEPDDHGADVFISKPFGMADMLGLIKGLKGL